MQRIAYVNGEFVPEEKATVSIFDRGFLFGDGVYEVTTVLGGRLVDSEGHLARLRRSLGELRLPLQWSEAEIAAAQTELVRRNDLDEGVVYLQITRGAGQREFGCPAAIAPTIIIFAHAKKIVDSPLAKRGISVVSLPEFRWKRRDLKTVALIAACMGKQAALDAGADDGWFVEDGFVTEGTSNNTFIVTRNETLVTRRLGSELLAGVTRKAVLALSREQGIVVDERAFSIEEAYSAAEAFSTSASSLVQPVVRIDGHMLGDGRPGPITCRLRQLYIDSALAIV